MLTQFRKHSLLLRVATQNTYGEDVITYSSGGDFEGWISYNNYQLIQSEGWDITGITHNCLVKTGVKTFHRGDVIDGIYTIKFIQENKRYTVLYLSELKDKAIIT